MTWNECTHAYMRKPGPNKDERFAMSLIKEQERFLYVVMY